MSTDSQEVAVKPRKTITLELEVGEPVLISSGVYSTKLTHPTLEGDLTLVHNSKSREATLDSLENDAVSLEAEGIDVAALATNVVGLIKTAQQVGLFSRKPKQ